MSDWTERFKNPEKKLHRDEKPVPIDPVERASRMQWLLNHPMWRVPHTYGGGEVHMDDMFARCVDFWFHHRDPETDDVSDDPSKNTKFSILIEAGPPMDNEEWSGSAWYEPVGGWDDHNRWVGSHDLRLDVWADDMETGLLLLASRVELFYGEDGKAIRPDCPGIIVPEPWLKDGNRRTDEGDDPYVVLCHRGSDGYCDTCGHWVAYPSFPSEEDPAAFLPPLEGDNPRRGDAYDIPGRGPVESRAWETLRLRASRQAGKELSLAEAVEVVGRDIWVRAVAWQARVLWNAGEPEDGDDIQRDLDEAAEALVLLRANRALELAHQLRTDKPYKARTRGNGNSGQALKDLGIGRKRRKTLLKRELARLQAFAAK